MVNEKGFYSKKAQYNQLKRQDIGEELRKKEFLYLEWNLSSESEEGAAEEEENGCKL